MADSNAGTQWYFSVNGTTCGPVSLAALQQMARTNHLRPDSLVWNNSTYDRVRADSLPFLFPSRDTAGQSPALPPEPTSKPRPNPSTIENPPPGHGAGLVDGRAKPPQHGGDRAAPGIPSKPRRMPRFNGDPADLFLSRDRQLVAECLAGHETSWHQFVDRFAGLLAFVIDRTAAQRRITLGATERDHLLSAVLLGIMQQDAAVLEAFRGKSRLHTYLMVVGRRLAVRELAKLPDLRRDGTCRSMVGTPTAAPSSCDERQPASLPPTPVVPAPVASTRELYGKGLVATLAFLCLGFLLNRTMSGQTPHRLTAVSGTVTYRDGSPLPVPAFRLRFHPLARPARAVKKPPVGHAAVDGATGEIAQATTIHAGDGITVGLCRVTIHGTDGGGLPAQVIDERYQFVRSTPLIIDTREQPLNIRLDLPKQH